MRQPRVRLLAMAGSVLAAGAIALSGVVAATASPHTSHGVSGIEHFQLVSTSSSPKTNGHLIAYGVFTKAGTDVVTGNLTDIFKFRNGTIHVHHSAGKGTQRFNPHTCLLQISLHGTYRLVSGTGRYAGISGHGTYRLSILAIGARSHGKCTQRKPPVAFQQIIRASGPVHL